MNFYSQKLKMNCHSKKIMNSKERIAGSRKKLNSKHYTLNVKESFSLIETVAALFILALVCSSVLVVINRCMSSAADSVLRMQAFEVARENMEKLLALEAVKEMAEFGSSDKYPQIQWQTIVEPFYEPITERMWIRAVCSGQYTDTEGNPQTVELTHWLTDVTKKQLLEILQQEAEEQARFAEQIIGSIEEAAQYAGVEVETIQQWVENGMLTAEDGSFIKSNLDLYKQTDGNPPAEAKAKQVESPADLKEPIKKQDKPEQQEPPSEEDWRNEIDPITGLTYGELMEMSFEELWDLLEKLGY